MYIAELVKFGLSEKEARAYLALLELEVATAHEVAEKAELNRSSTYVVLDSLQARGLLSISTGKKIKKFIVEPPERILQIAESTTRTHSEIQHGLNAILPDLKSLYKEIKQKPKVKIYKGKAGLISAFEDTLRTKEKLIRIISSTDDIQNTLPDYLPLYVKKRMKLGIRMHGIHPYTPKADYLRENITKGIDEVHLIPYKMWNFKSDIAIYDASIGFMLHKELISIHIESEAIADSMKKIFDLAFKESNRLNIIKQKEK